MTDSTTTAVPEPASESTGRWTRRWPALASPGFRTLTGAWVFTNLADSALFLMAAVWVKDLTGSDSLAGLVFAAMGLPALFAPLLGHLADRMSRKTLLVLSNAGIAVLLLALLLVRDPGHAWIIHLVIFFYGTVGFLTASAQSGLIRDLLPDSSLASGNSLLSMVDQSFRLLSPIIGTVIYAIAGPYAVVLVTVALFGIAAVLLIRVRVTESPVEEPDAESSWWTEVTAGFRHLARTSPLGRLTVLVAIAFGVTGLVNVAVFPLMEQGLGVNPEMLGPLVSVQGVGALLAGATATWVIGRVGEARTVGIGLGLVGLAVAAILLESLPVALGALALLGGGVTWVVIAYVTMRQRLTPPRLQGRTSAAANMAFNLPQTLFTIFAAGILVFTDYRMLMLATAVILLASAAFTPWRRRA